MKNITILLLLLCGMTVFSQKSTSDRETEWFDELVEDYYEGDYMTAYLGFGQFVKHYPKSSLVPRAIFNQACLLRELGRDEDAKVVFRKIMNSNFDEQEAYGGIMEQYALYKNRSAKHLAEIYLNENDFNNAGKYIHLFDKIYPYQHFCGNELSANAIYTDTMYAKMYHGKGKTEKAIKKLLPHMFYNGLAGNQEVLDLLNQYLPLVYSNSELITLLEVSISDFQIIDNDWGKLKFLNVRVPVYTYQLYDFNNTGSADDLDLKGKAAFLEIFKNHPVLSNYLVDNK